MTLEDLGNLGEFVGAIAVVITLVYLSIQIRHNTRMMRHQILRSRHDALNQTYREVYSVPGLSDLLTRSREDADAPENDSERAKLVFRLVAHLNTVQDLYYQRKLGLLDESLTRIVDTIPQVVLYAFARRWWVEEGRTWAPFSEEFARHVDAVLKEYESAA